jgi:hypothetical protein
MSSSIDVNACPRPSADIVSRVIDGQILIIPLVSGVGDLEEELYTLNDTGKDIWDRLDGTRTLEQIVKEMSAEFEASEDVLRTDVLGLVEELLKRKILVVG